MRIDNAPKSALPEQGVLRWAAARYSIPALTTRTTRTHIKGRAVTQRMHKACWPIFVMQDATHV